MGVSTRGRYGLKFMLDLAVRHGAGAVPLGDIARRQGISEKYLWQVLSPLRGAGLIAVTRGSRGGYALARAPSAITVWDVLSALEGEGFPFGCPARKGVERGEGAILGELWRELDRAAAAAMTAVTLENLVERIRKREANAPPMYVI